MQDRVIARRNLKVVLATGASKDFEIAIGAPFATNDGDYCCEIGTEDVLFPGTLRVFGIDAVDAVDYAIQALDRAADEYRDGTLLWRDGSSYERVASNDKFGWGHG